MASSHALNAAQSEHDALLKEDDAILNTAPTRPLVSTVGPKVQPKSSSSKTVTVNVTYSGHMTNQPWSTIWLQKRMLVSLMALFGTIIASLFVLHEIDLSRNGFRLTLGSNHYAWTYGPTAFLTVVLGIWRQLDFHCKILQPWQDLRRGPCAAERTILLDYAGPINFTSFVRAIRLAHYAVVASITGFLVLKLVILLSTGLLVTRPTLISGPYDSTISLEFGPGRLWDTVETRYSDEPSPESSYWNLSTLPVHSYSRLLKEDPRGLVESGSSIAYQKFTTSPKDGLRDLTLQVDVFRPDVNCEIAKSFVDTTGYMPTFSLESETCSVESAPYVQMFDTGGAPAVPDCRPSESAACLEPHFGYWGWAINCSDPLHPEPSVVVPTSDLPDYDIRLALAIGNISEGGSIAEDLSSRSGVRFHDTAAVICKMDYSIAQAAVTQYVSQDRISINELGQDRQLQSFTGFMLTQTLVATLRAADGELSVDGKDSVFINSMMYLLLQTSEAGNAMERLLNETTLRDSAMQVWSGIATEFMREWYLQPTNEPAIGRAHFTEDRLHVALPSLWGMVVGCLVLEAILLVLLRQRPTHSHLLHDPRRISTSAIILAISKGLDQLMSSKGDLLRTSQLSGSLDQHDFRLTARNALVFEPLKTARPDRQTERKRGRNKDPKSWTPLSARPYIVCFTFFMPALIIVAIEILYQGSRQSRGIADVSDSEDAAAALSRILPALAMFLMATCINSLDFTIASFAPFSLLRTGGVTAKRGLDFHVLGEPPPTALWRSTVAGHFPTLFSSLAGIIGSVLTIASAGLFVIDRNVDVGIVIKADLMHSWNVDWSHSATSGDGGAGVQLNHIQRGSTQMPTTIWNNIVLPEIVNIASEPVQSSTILRTWTLEVDGLYPELSCELIEPIYVQAIDVATSPGF